MLPRTARLARRRDFALVVRRGRRAARGRVVMHLVRVGGGDGGPVVGFVVSRAVGGSVVRHRVQRKLRHLMRERLHQLPGDARVVVRAQPAASTASSAVLGGDLDAALCCLAGEGGRG